MTKEDLAAKLNGRMYLEEMSGQESVDADAAGLLVLFGYSDDNVELRGVIEEEIGAYNGTTLRITRDCVLAQDVDRDDEEVLEKYGVLEEVKRRASEAHKIKAVWGQGAVPWTFETDLPHATFDIVEDDEVFCRGIVIDKQDLL